MSQEPSVPDSPEVLTFTRPDPTCFALFIARMGPGTGNVVGTQTFKPAGTEWATEKDLQDAGFIRLTRIQLRLERLFVMASEAAVVAQEGGDPTDALHSLKSAIGGFWV